MGSGLSAPEFRKKPGLFRRGGAAALKEPLLPGSDRRRKTCEKKLDTAKFVVYYDLDNNFPVRGLSAPQGSFDVLFGG
jgi:hypothetical protein